MSRAGMLFAVPVLPVLHSIGSACRQAQGVQYWREVRLMVIAFIAAAALLYLLSEWALWQA